MPKFMVQAKYTPEALQRLIKQPENRFEKNRPVYEKAGAKIEHGWFTVGGDYDIAYIVNAPDATTMESLRIMVDAGGSVTSQKVTQLLTPEEGIDALRRASGVPYRPIGG